MKIMDDYIGRWLRTVFIVLPDEFSLCRAKPFGLFCAVFVVLALALGVVGAQADPHNKPFNDTPTLLIASLSVTPGAGTYGTVVTGKVTLNAPTPKAIRVHLHSFNRAVAMVPDLVRIAAGNDNASFNVALNVVSVSTPVTISATTSGVSQYTSLTVQALSLTSLSINPSTVMGGATATGIVALNAPTPKSITVSLSSSNTAAATVPSSVKIAAGATSASFKVTSKAVTQTAITTIKATASGVSQSATLTVQPLSLASLILNPSTLIGGATAIGTVTLNGPTPKAINVNLSSSNTTVATVPAGVKIAAGAASASFNITSKAVSATTVATIKAIYSGVTQSAALTVQTPWCPVSLTFTPATVQGGWPSMGTVMLNENAPTGGTTVTLTSSNPSVLVSPATMTVPAGSNGAVFNVNTNFVSSDTPVTVTASTPGGSALGVLDIQPLQQPAVTLSTSANPAVVGQSLTLTAVVQQLTGLPIPTGTVTFYDGAAVIGAVVLDSTGQATLNAALAQGTHNLTVAYGGDASYNPSTSTALSQVINPVAWPVSVTFDPPSVEGGWPSMGIVMLNGNAPTGDLTVTLTSSNPAVLVSPATMTVPAGSNGAVFNVSTNFVSSDTQVTVTASTANGSASGVLDIQPLQQPTVTLTSSANPSVVGQSLTLTAVVQQLTGLPIPTGTVTFYDGTAVIGAVVLDSTGQATLNATLAQGTHNLTVAYGGDASYNPSTSTALSQVVNPIGSNSTQTSLVSSVNPSTTGQTVVFTATVTSAGGTPTGSVQFMDGAALLGTSAVLDTNGQATLATSGLAAGSHTITAVYSGDSNNTSSTSNTLSQVVNQATSNSTQVSLVSSVNPSSAGQTVIFTATVTSTGGIPTGSVQFMDGTTNLGTSATLDSNGQAVLATSGLAAGTHTITAVYSGDSNNAGSTSNAVSQVVNQVAPPNSLPRDMQILVIVHDGQESSALAIEQTMQYMGVPYTVFSETQNPGGITASTLANGSHGFYQGIVIVFNTNQLADSEQQALQSYEETFGVRQVTMYAVPGPDCGFNAYTGWTDTTATPLTAYYTPTGSQIFSYVNTANPLVISGVVAFQATALPTSQPLISDAQGNALAVLTTGSDGRQGIVLGFDNSPYLTHSITLGYGLVNWVTDGVFLGERHVYASPQVDDYFISDWVYPSTTVSYRINGNDVKALVAWQQATRNNYLTSQLHVTMAFNGVGTTPSYYDSGTTDSLVTATEANSGEFYWVTHTYDHSDLDGISYTAALAEFQDNIAVAGTGPGGIGLQNFDPLGMVTPSITGLTDANAMQAAYDSGIRYIVTDTSVPGYNNPSPNAGLYNVPQPAILMIPRRPNGLYANVGTPDEWIPEYNLYNTPQVTAYSQILNQQSNDMLQYLLNGETDPWMFHEINLEAYDGVHCLMGDLLDSIFTKYAATYNLPILSPPMTDLGIIMANRMTYNASGVVATWTPGQSIVVTVNQGARIPVTGLNATGSEIYGGQPISYFVLGAGQTLTIPLQSSAGDGAVAGSGVTSTTQF